MNSSIMQNLSDPDATYQEKAGKKHRNYAVNVEKYIEKNGSVITDYLFDSNNKINNEFFQENIEKIGLQEEKPLFQQMEHIVVKKTTVLPPKNNIDLVTTNLPEKM